MKIISMLVAVVFASLFTGCGRIQSAGEKSWEEKVLTGKGVYDATFVADTTATNWTVVTNFAIPPTELFQVVLETDGKKCLAVSARQLPVGTQVKVHWRAGLYREASQFLVPAIQVQ